MDIKLRYTFMLLMAIIATYWPQLTNAQLNQLSPGQMFPPRQKCPDLMCSLQFIPEECREIPTIQINGNNCAGCPRWKTSCTRPTDGTQNVACPVMNCPDLGVSKECEIVEAYEYNGRNCFSCPKIRPQCAETSTKTPQVACPIQACPLIFVPAECREIPTFIFMGRKCDGCPRWRSGCNPTLPDNTNSFRQVKPEVACPMVACDSYVPSECREISEFQFRGKMCQGCPKWRVGCREQERISSFGSSGFTNTVPAIPVKCPSFPCSSVTIPTECIQEQPFEYRGKTCFRCPIWRAGCLLSNPNYNAQSQTPEVPCPMINCEVLNVPDSCLQEELYMFNGRMCNKCSSIKAACRSFIQPRPFVSETGRQLQPEVKCPLKRCPLLLIPEECMEIETFIFEGKTCEGCPRFKPGCIPSTLPPQENKPNACPLVACETYIPEECRDLQPYQFQGKTCYGCPKRKPNCFADTTSQVGTQVPNKPEMACPSFKCNKMFIPIECRDEQPFDFQGRTCFMCPKFRKGCIPNDMQAEPTLTNKLAELTQTQPELKPFIDVIPSKTPEMACPMSACPELKAVPECIEEQPYQFQGKICYSCPTLKQDCVGNSGSSPVDSLCPMLACPRIKIPQECEEIKVYEIHGKTCPECPRWKDGCKPGVFQPSTGQFDNLAGPIVACPLMNCKDNQIPQKCIEEQPYQFQGQTCFRCPIWRIGCEQEVPTDIVNKSNKEYPPAVERKVASVACPLVDCSRDSIPDECKEEVTYQFMGLKTCLKCPKWRQGCVRANSVDLQTQIRNQTKDTVPVNGIPSVQEIQNVNPVVTSQENRPMRIADLNGIIPVQSLLSSLQRAACPRLPCPAIQIPVQCRENRSYIYNGIRCPACPTWRQNCQTGPRQQPNMNVNGIIAYSLFNEMMTKR